MTFYRKSRVPDYDEFMHWFLIVLACGGARVGWEYEIEGVKVRACGVRYEKA